MRRLEGKIAIVTGAGSIGAGWGNGKATAVQFAREGASVMACDINPEAVAETQRLIAAEGGTCETATCDVSAAADVASLVERCLDRFGRVDILHNNVGIYKIGGPPDLTENDWDLVIATNLRGLYLTCRHVIPVMERQGGGAIVNIGSISGLRFMGLPQIAYATSKGAVISFTQGIAAQYGPKGIRSNCVVPGVIHTPVMELASDAAYSNAFGSRSPAELHKARAACIPLRRMGTAWDVAQASVFLASEEAGYVTGAALIVDGGFSLTTQQPASPASS